MRAACPPLAPSWASAASTVPRSCRSSGGWEEAEREAARVCAELAHFDVGTHRRGTLPAGRRPRAVGRPGRGRGRLSSERTPARGVIPSPGLALLRLAQGRAVGAAAGRIQAALAGERRNRLARARLLRRPGRRSPWPPARSTGPPGLRRDGGDRRRLRQLRAARPPPLQARGRGPPGRASDHRRPCQTLAGRLPRLAAVERPLRSCQDPPAAGPRLHRAGRPGRGRARARRGRGRLRPPRAPCPMHGAVAELRSGTPFPDGLTEREAEVLAEVAGRQDQPRDRGGARDQREDRRPPSLEYLHQARPVVAHGGGGLCHRARPDRAPAWVIRPIPSVLQLYRSPDAARRPPPYRVFTAPTNRRGHEGPNRAPARSEEESLDRAPSLRFRLSPRSSIRRIEAGLRDQLGGQLLMPEDAGSTVRDGSGTG